MGTQRQGRSDGAAPVQYQPGGVFNCLCIRLLFERIDALAQALNSLYKAELICNGERPGYAGPRLRRPLARSERSNAKPSPGSVGTTPAASTSLWAASRHYKQKTNAQQHERKRPQQASIKPGTWQTMRGPLHPLRGAAPVMWRCTRYVALHPLRGAAPEQKGCNAYGSGALPLRTSESVVSVGHGMVVEVGLNNRRRASGVLLRYRRCVWTGVQGTSHWRCTRYGPLHP